MILESFLSKKRFSAADSLKNPSADKLSCFEISSSVSKLKKASENPIDAIASGFGAPFGQFSIVYEIVVAPQRGPHLIGSSYVT